jgi:hypothetical protein
MPSYFFTMTKMYALSFDAVKKKPRDNSVRWLSADATKHDGVDLLLAREHRLRLVVVVVHAGRVDEWYFDDADVQERHLVHGAGVDEADLGLERRVVVPVLADDCLEVGEMRTNECRVVVGVVRGAVLDDVDLLDAAIVRGNVDLAERGHARLMVDEHDVAAQVHDRWLAFIQVLGDEDLGGCVLGAQAELADVLWRARKALVDQNRSEVRICSWRSAHCYTDTQKSRLLANRKWELGGETRTGARA